MPHCFSHAGYSVLGTGRAYAKLKRRDKLVAQAKRFLPMLCNSSRTAVVDCYASRASITERMPPNHLIIAI